MFVNDLHCIHCIPITESFLNERASVRLENILGLANVLSNHEIPLLRAGKGTKEQQNCSFDCLRHVLWVDYPGFPSWKFHSQETSQLKMSQTLFCTSEVYFTNYENVNSAVWG